MYSLWLVFKYREFLYLTDRGNHRNRFLLSLTEIRFYISYLLYYVYIIILYYYQGRAECRFKDFAFLSALMRVSLGIEADEERDESRVNAMTYTCLELAVIPQLWYAWDDTLCGKQAEIHKKCIGFISKNKKLVLFI